MKAGLYRLGCCNQVAAGDSAPTDKALKSALLKMRRFSRSVLITLSAGTILDASGRTDHTLRVASGQTLNGVGSVFGNLTIAAGATLAPGANGIGTLTVNSNQ